MRTDAPPIPRTVGVVGGMSLIIGSMIGSGIFASPGSVLLHAGSVGLSLVLWVVAGAIALLGSLCYCELGTAIPTSGGEYIYIQRVWGDVPAFLYTWSTSVVTKPGCLAIICLVCAEYATKPFYAENVEPSPWLVKGLAIAIIVFMSVVNAVSVDLAMKIQNLFTGLKLVAIAMVTCIGLIWYIRHAGDPAAPAYINYHDTFKHSATSPPQIGLALLAGLWSYEGWNSINYIMDELQDPLHSLPRALLLGLPLVAICYIAANMAYFAVMPQSEMVDFENKVLVEGFASVFGLETLGLAGEIILPLCIVMSTFGAANGSCFTGGRLVYVSAREGHLPAFLGHLWGEHNPTPMRGLAFEGILAILMLLLGDFESLLAAFSVAAWLFYALTISCLLRLRYTHPDMPRPFKVHLWIPCLFFLIACLLVVAILVKDPVLSAVALGTIAAGMPLRYFGEKMFWPAISKIPCLSAYVPREQARYSRVATVEAEPEK